MRHPADGEDVSHLRCLEILKDLPPRLRTGLTCVAPPALGEVPRLKSDFLILKKRRRSGTRGEFKSHPFRKRKEGRTC